MLRIPNCVLRPASRVVIGLLLALAVTLGGQQDTLGQVIDDHGDDRDHATTISLGGSATGTIDPATDEDFFTFALTGSTSVKVSTSGSLDTVGQLQDSVGEVLQTDDDIDYRANELNFEIIARLAPGTYYVKVRSFRADPPALTGDYTLTVSELPDQGETKATAGTLTLDGSIDARILPGNDVDMFELVLSSATDVEIYTTGELDTIGKLIHPNNDITENDDRTFDASGRNFLIRESLAAGTYYVSVESFQSRTFPTTGLYTLHADSVADAGDSRSQAQTIAVGDSAKETMFDADDIDFFRFTLAQQTDVRAYTTGFVNTLAVLENQGGSELATGDDWGFQRLTRNFHIRQSLGAGTYYLKVESTGSTAGEYELHLETVPSGFDPVAGAIELALNRKTSGNISSVSDFDLYEIDLSAAAEIEFDIDSVIGSRLVSSLYSDQGIETPGNGRDYALDAGTYYFRVTSRILVRPTGLVASAGSYAVTPQRNTTYESFQSGCAAVTTSHDDPLYGCQWHLDNRGRNGGSRGQDINVEDAWQTTLGANVNVLVVDNGLDPGHEDLADNVDLSRNFDVLGDGRVLRPQFSHGTAVAGLIAARDNDLGVRGVAPQATIYAHNVLARGTDADFLAALLHEQDATRISNNSWGAAEGPGLDTVPFTWELALEQGISAGAGGKGIVYVFSAGNGDPFDYSNLEEYVNHYGVTAACAVDDRGFKTSTSEQGSNLWVCAPSRQGGRQAIVTTDNYDRYRNTFGGTSASAPQVSGVAALVLAANDSLTWRDVKLVLATSARKNDPGNRHWLAGAPKYRDEQNSYSFNHRYGFGVVDAAMAVELALDWVALPPFTEVEVDSGNLGLAIPDSPRNPVEVKLTLPDGVSFIEYIELQIDFEHDSVRDLKIELVSPAGRTSLIAPDRLVIVGGQPIAIPWDGRFRFGSARHLGEDASGEWTLRITDRINQDAGLLGSWQIIAYGHRRSPGQPTVIAAAALDRALSIDWHAPESAAVSEVTGFDLRYIETSADESVDSNWTMLGGVASATQTRYQLTNLSNDTGYDVQVRAFNSDGAGPWSDTVTGTPALVPGIASISDAKPGNTLVTIDWTAPSAPSGAPVTGYDLRHIEADKERPEDADWVVLSNVWSSGDLSYSVSNLQNGTEPRFQVRAYNANGAGPWSPAESATPRTTPGAPTLDPIDGYNTRLLITWSPPSDNGGAEITAYHLRRIESAATDKSDANWTGVDNIWQSGSGTLAYSLTNLTNGTSYDVQVEAENAAGRGGWSGTRTGTPGDKPDAPTIASVTASDTDLTLTWASASGGGPANRYDLRHKESSDPDVSASWRLRTAVWSTGSGALSYQLTGLKNGTAYDVQVRGGNASGSGPWSVSASATPQGVPGTPELDDVVPGPQRLTVTWKGPDSDGGSAITSYDLRHKESADPDQPASWTEISPAWTSGSGTLEYEISGLENGTSYDVQVRAVNSVDPGPWSILESKTPSDTLGPPLQVVARAQLRALEVSWDAPAGAPGIVTWDLRYIRSDATDRSDDQWEIDSRISRSAPYRHTLSGLLHATNYDVQVRGYNPSGAGQWSDAASGTPYDQPGKPSLAPLVLESRAITVHWDRPADDGGADITSYDLQYWQGDAPDPNTNWILRSDIWQVTRDTKTRFRIGNLQNGSRHWVRIRAENGGGESSWSNARSGVPRTSPGPPPQPIISPGQWELEINWNRPPDDGGADVTAYDLRRKETSAPDEPASWTDVSNIWTNGGGDLEYTLSSLNNGTSYDIQVRAVNEAGPGTWSQSGKGTPRTTPGRPVITAIEAGHQRLNTEWTAPTDTGGNAISSYDVRRKRSLDPDVSASWTEFLGAWKSGGSQDLEYRVGGLVNGTSYDVQVRAVNDAGPGEWSFVDRGTPITVPSAPAIASVEPFDESLEIAWLEPGFDGFAGIDSYDLRHKMSRDPDQPRYWTEAIGVRTGFGPRQYRLGGLENGIAFDVQVRAVNPAGDGGWSTSRPGTPRTAPDPPAIASVDPGDRSLTVRWRAPSENGGSAITSYDVRSKRAQDPDTASSWREEIEVWTTGAGALQHTLAQLANGTRYDVQVRAVNGANGSDWSGTEQGTPTEMAPAPAITELTPGDRSLTVIWDPPTDLGGNTLEGYSIRYKLSSAPAASRNWTELIDAWQSGSQLEHVIDQLHNGNSHDVQVRAETSGDPGPWSQPRSATPRTRPSGPPKPRAAARDRALLINWQRPADDGGAEITSYDAQYRQSSATSWGPVVFGIWQTGDGDLEFTLSPGAGLDNRTKYDLQLRAVNVAGAGPWSDTTSGTPATLPRSPVPTGAVPGRGSLTLTWEAPSDHGGAEISAYDLRYKRSSDPDSESSWSVVSSVWQIGDGAYEHAQSLAGGTEYDVQLRAVNAVGAGPWSGSTTAISGARRGGGGGGGGRRPPEPLLPSIDYAIKVLDNRYVQDRVNQDLKHNIPELAVTFPDGRVVPADFLGHYLETGALTRWGFPTSEVMVLEDGTLTQFYQRGAADFHDVGAGWVVERRLAWDYVGGGVRGAPDHGVEPGVLNPNPGTPLGPWRHKVSDIAIDGTEVGFADFFNRHGGVGAFGLPKSDARVDSGAAGTLLEPGKTPGFIRQYFQAAVFEYHPDIPQSPVMLSLLGDTLRGVLVPDHTDHAPFNRAEPLVKDQDFEPFLVPQPADA